MENICRICSKEFKPKFFKSRVRYCSKKCKLITRNYTQRGKRRLSLEWGIVNNRVIEESIYIRYKTSAKKKKLQFDLVIGHIFLLWGKDCHWCGDKIETVGIDRVDSNKGYTLDNIVPCCTECNLMKRHMNHIKFIEKCRAVSAKHYKSSGENSD